MDDKRKFRNLDWLYRNKSQNRFLLIMILKFIFVLLGLLAIFSDFLGTNSQAILILLYVVMEAVSANFIRTRNAWEAFHRELELNDSLGHKIQKHIDILPFITRKQNIKIESGNYYEDSYYSTNTASTSTAFKNVLESSWWSKHLAHTTSTVYLIITIFIVLASTIVIFSVIQNSKDPEVIKTVVEIVVPIVFFIFSMDFIKLYFGYRNFSSECEKIENKARDFLSHNNQDPLSAYSLWFEYQLSRSQAPLIPKLVWHFKKDRLNEIWKSSY